MKETDIINNNEEDTKIGRCTGYCGNQDDSLCGGHRNPKGYKEAVIPELRLKE